MDISSIDLKALSIDDLFRLLAEVRKTETECIEFKDNIIKPSVISDYITQFANNRGGLLILGMTDDGKPSGKIMSYDKTNEISIFEGDLNTKPPVNIEIQPYEYTTGNCWVIAIKIPKPTDGIPRISSSGALVKRVGTRRAIIEQSGNTYEGRILKDLHIDLLDDSLINNFLTRIKTKVPALRMENQDLLKLFNLAGYDEGGLLHPTMAGLILFGISPDVIVSGTRVNIIRYTNAEKTNAIEESIVLSGPILRTIEEANQKVWSLIRRMTYFNAGKRDEISEYPRLAIREAINNAFFHNDYSIKGNLFIEIFPDRLEIKNMGIPLGGTRLVDLVGKPKHRNPTILKILDEWGFVEGWGIGLKTIIENCKTNGLPEPKLIVSDDETCLCFKSHSLLDEPTLKWISNITRGLTSDLNHHQILALAYAKHKEKITNLIYQQLNAVNNRVASNELRELCSSGLFVSLGRGKNAYYTLTELFDTDSRSLEEYFPKEVVFKLKNPQKKILSIIAVFGRINAKQIFFQSGYSDERGVKRILNGLVRLQVVNRIAKKPSDPSAYYELNSKYIDEVEDSPIKLGQLTFKDML